MDFPQWGLIALDAAFGSICAAAMCNVVGRHVCGSVLLSWDSVALCCFPSSSFSPFEPLSQAGIAILDFGLLIWSVASGHRAAGASRLASSSSNSTAILLAASSIWLAPWVSSSPPAWDTFSFEDSFRRKMNQLRQRQRR